MIAPSQILLAIIVLFIVLRTVIAYRDKKLSRIFVSVWLVFWLILLFLIFEQEAVSALAHTLRISRGVDLVIYVSLILIFYIIYRLLIKINELENIITKMVRKIALKDRQVGK